MEIREFTIEQAEGDPVTFKIAPTPIVRLVNARRLFDTGALDTEDGMKALIAAIFWGARRAGSKITLEWLETNVDTRNAVQLFTVFRELNELTPKSIGAARGEAPAATSTSSMTSPESPPTS